MIDALVISVDDPQLERCLSAVRNQTVPFTNVIHLNNVCPNYRAVSLGMSKTFSDWVIHVAGDVVLDLDAVERISKFMEENKSDKMCGYYFGLRDEFLNCEIGYIGAVKGFLYRNTIFPDTCANDHQVLDQLKKQGWKTVNKLHMTVGTHFENPDERQVFARFYLHGARFGKRIAPVLTDLLNKTGSPLYETALKAIHYALDKKRYYPGSHNLEFDRKNYEEWKQLQS